MNFLKYGGHSAMDYNHISLLEYLWTYQKHLMHLNHKLEILLGKLYIYGIGP